MKFVLICHHDEPLSRTGLASWLNTIGELSGIIEIRENRSRMKKRIKSELKRSGMLGFIDVMAFVIYYKNKLAHIDKAYEKKALHDLQKKYGEVPSNIPILATHSPNSDEAKEFLLNTQPDFTIARCKTILKADIFNVASRGTYVMHPGICPEYRNAHGCFWAMVNEDYDNIGMTLLRVDDGIDTGPVYGYFKCKANFLKETHNTIQNKVVLDNLNDIEVKFQEIYDNTAKSIDTKGRSSGVWGQPWLSKYLKWKKKYTDQKDGVE